MKDLFLLYAYEAIKENTVTFLHTGMIDKKCIRLVEKLYNDTLLKIKPEALILCEAFIFDENIV